MVTAGISFVNNELTFTTDLWFGCKSLTSVMLLQCLKCHFNKTSFISAIAIK